MTHDFYVETHTGKNHGLFCTPHKNLNPLIVMAITTKVDHVKPYTVTNLPLLPAGL